jgi:hypothetical protein
MCLHQRETTLNDFESFILTSNKTEIRKPILTNFSGRLELNKVIQIPDIDEKRNSGEKVMQR